MSWLLTPPTSWDLFFSCTFISVFQRWHIISYHIDLPPALLIKLSFGFFFAKTNKMSTVILSKWAVFFTLWSIFCSNLSESSANFYHSSETPNFSEDSSWDSLSILLLLLQLLSIRPEATETPPSSNSFPAASTAIACFLNFSVHQRGARGSREHAGNAKGRRDVLPLMEQRSHDTHTVF